MSDKTQTLDEKSKSPKSSRRSMLRLAVPAAAGVAALAAAGATEALRPSAVRAAPNTNGDNFIIGSILNEATTLTELANQSTSGGVGGLLVVDEDATAGDNTFGIAGNSFNNAGTIGLSGRGTLVPNGDTDAIDKSFTGVIGAVYHNNGDPNVGLGYGVVARSNRGAAPLLLQSVTGGTANTASNFSKGAANGSMNVDNNGTLYSRRYSAWYPLLSGEFLSTPLRLLDTRAGASGAADTPNAPVQAGTAHTFHLPVAGVTYSGVSIPAGAKGFFGNCTVVNPAGVGDLAMYPDGLALPNTAVMHYLTGQIVSNGVTMGLGSNGKVSITALGSATDVIVDCQGFFI